MENTTSASAKTTAKARRLLPIRSYRPEICPDRGSCAISGRICPAKMNASTAARDPAQNGQRFAHRSARPCQNGRERMMTAATTASMIVKPSIVLSLCRFSLSFQAVQLAPKTSPRSQSDRQSVADLCRPCPLPFGHRAKSPVKNQVSRLFQPVFRLSDRAQRADRLISPKERASGGRALSSRADSSAPQWPDRRRVR